jgi:hypothetical protein
MSLSKSEIMDETFEFYGSDPTRRATNDRGGCQYITDNGNMCAVGRCMTEEAIEEYGSFSNDVSDLAWESSGQYDSIDALLKPEYQGHKVEFWQNLQVYHDEDECFAQGQEDNAVKNRKFRENDLKQCYGE